MIGESTDAAKSSCTASETVFGPIDWHLGRGGARREL